MKKSNGFSFIEILIAASLLMTFVSIIVPIISLVQTEREVLSERRNFTLKLHDELQSFLWMDDTALPSNFAETLQQKEIEFSFKSENGFVKGCAEWQNAKKENESFCLYGYPKK
ncbi:hypothetical protein [Virgibacillus kimchii]